MSETYRIDKVKYDGVKVRLEFARLRTDERWDELAIASFDHPRPQFQLALKALDVDVCDICEIPPACAEKLEIRGVSFSRTNDVMGAVITALKHVKTAQSPVVLNTPHLTVEPYSEEGGGIPLLPSETVARLEVVIDEAIAYIEGDRAQRSLFTPPGAPQPGESTT